MSIEPVFGKKLFGREEVIGTLQKRVTDLKGGYRQNLALTGPMLGGKSSILRHFLKNTKDSDVVLLYLEMDGVDFDFFCRQFMASLLYHYLKSIGRKAGNDSEALKKEAGEMIPRTVQSIDEVEDLLVRKKNNAAYEKTLNITSVFKQETGKNCVVILDEFHNLYNFKLKKPFQVFGKFIMVQKNTMYIVSSSQKSLLKDILDKKLSLLFGNFEILEINGFDSRTAHSFLSSKTKDTDIDTNIKDYLIQITQGGPFYLENLALKTSDIKRKSGDAKKDDKECLLDALAELLYESNGVLNQYFTNNINFFLEKNNRRKFIPVLVSLACGKRTSKEIQKDLGKADKDMGKKLQKLQDMDLVLNSGSFYYISDKLFEYWLKFVYDLKGRSLIDDMGIKYLEFKKAVNEDYQRYSSFRDMDEVSIILDLFKGFGGEKIQINMKPRKMPKFEEVETKRISSAVFQITGRTGKRSWTAYIKQNGIVEDKDVYDLWDMKASGKDEKIMRKIMIPLKGIEQNAYLLAKEQNIWVWELKEINKILRLFGKFEIVR